MAPNPPSLIYLTASRMGLPKILVLIFARGGRGARLVVRQQARAALQVQVGRLLLRGGPARVSKNMW